jgi:TP901 family phage tail tape measure protein
MAKKISSSDLFDKEDIFEGIRLSAQKTIQDLKQIDEEFKRVAKTMRETLGKSKVNTTQGIQEFTKATQDANKAVENSIKIEKLKAQAEQQALRAEQEREKVAQQKLRTQSAQAKEQERLNKIQERSAKVARDEANAYKQLEKNTRELKNESKRLGAELLKLENSGKRNTKEYHELEKQYKQTTRAAQSGDAQLKKLDKTVGDNQRNVGNYIGGIKDLAGAFGLAFGVQAVANVFKTGTEAIIEFDQAIADLQAITGASGKDLEYYREQANLLGKDVEGGASAVVEAYKLIGSAKPELLTNAEALNQVTQSAITLAQAAGMSVPDAATNLTDAMNQFGASADDADKFINVLAAGSKFGAVEIPQVTEALLKFGAVAKTSGVSIEETGALIEALGERGLKGAEAGTALRNVMLKLSAPDALPKEAISRLTDLGINFDTLKDKSIPFTERLRALGPLLNDQAALVKTFGTENAVAATNLIQLTDRTDELRQQMTGTNTAYEQAEQRTATLGHAIMQLKNSFIGMFTSIDTGSGTMKSIVSSIQFLAENLSTIVGVVMRITVAYGTYKSVLMALNLIEKARNTNFKELGKEMLKQIPFTKQYTAAQKEMANNQQQGASATKGLGSALAGVGWTIAIGVAMELAKVMYDVASGAKAAREQQELLDQYNANAQENADKRVTDRQKDLQKEIAELQRRRNENKLTEKEFLKLKEDAIKKTKEQITKDISLVRERKKTYLDDLEFAKTYMDKAEKDAKNRSGLNLMLTKEDTDRMKKITATYASQGTSVDKVIQKINASISGAGIKITTYKEELDGTTESVKDATSELKSNGVAHEDNTGKITAKIPKLKEINTEFKKTNDYLSKQSELLERLNVIEEERAITALEQRIENEVDLQESKIKETGKFDLTEFKNLVEEKYRLEVNRILNTADFEQEQNEEKYQREKQARIDALDEEYAELRKGAEENQEALKKIDQNYVKEKQKLADNEVLIYEDLKTQNQIIAKESTDEINALEKSKLDFVENTNENMLNAQESFNEKKTENNDTQSDEELKKLQDTEERKREIIKITSEFFQKQSEKRIEQYDKEIAAAEKQYEVLKGLAESGNINAQQSLAEQQRIIDEANRKKQQELQRQQRIKLAESVYSTYSQKVSDGSKNPLAETIRDTTLLQQFINSLPTFFDGTEDTGSNGRGIDGRGGFQAVLHPNERVIPKHLNEQIGAISNVDLARIAQEYKNGKIVEGGQQTKSALEFAVLVNELKDLKSVIQDKPETNIELGQITNSVMEIVQSRKQGNSVTYNRFKVRK